MCGRFTLMLDAEELKFEFGLQEIPVEYRPRYNVAPGQPLAVVTNWTSRQMEWMRWGLVPSWAKDPAIGNKMINARSETVQEKPSFRTAFSRRRCLILADGFYEWERALGKGQSTPFYFYLQDHKPFAFAGLWELWRSPGGEDLSSCAILTTAANNLVASVHDRMPVILQGAALTTWMGPGTSASWQALLQPYPADKMGAHSVSKMVNSSSMDRSEMVLSVDG